jgi:hypothetical protein
MLPVYFNQAPLFQVATGGAGGGGGEVGGIGGGGARPSGRGTLTDPDIVQGMPLAEPTQPRRSGGGEQVTDEQRLQQGPFFTPLALRPRIVLRFAADEKNLLISGMLAGGSELANAPAVVDVPVGQGHVVMFANNPMWRHQTQGSFFLLFNAALNYDHLGAGRERPADRGNEAARPSDDN